MTNDEVSSKFESLTGIVCVGVFTQSECTTRGEIEHELQQTTCAWMVHKVMDEDERTGEWKIQQVEIREDSCYGGEQRGDGGFV